MATASIAVRLNAITGEFEQAFSKATRTVSGFEKTFGNAASALDAHKKRIDSAFASLSGDSIIRDANAMATAVQRIGGAAKLTEAEQRRVNAAVTEAIAKYKALGQSAPDSLLRLEGATRQVAAATQQIEQPVSRLNGFFGDLGNQVKATALGFIGAQAVIGGVQTGFRALAGFVRGSVEAFGEAEAAQKKLTTALRASGQDVPAVAKQYNLLAAEFQRTSVYSDDLVNEMQALLTQVGDVMPADMEKALGAATNLASGLGIDLRQATLLVGKAFEGETGTLKRYGIVIDEAKLKAEGMPAVLDAIQSRFGGQAAAEIETYAGKIKQLENTWNDLQEAVGQTIATDAFIQAALRGASEAIKGTNDAASSGQRSLLEWWIALTGGTNNTYWNLWLLEKQEILKGQAEIEASARQLASLRPSAPSLFSGQGGPVPVAFDMKAYWKDQDQIAKAAKEAAAKAKQAAEQYAAAVDRLNEKTVELTAAQRLQVDAWTQQNKSASDMARVLRVNEQSIKAYTDAEKARTEATKMLAKESAGAIDWMIAEQTRLLRIGAKDAAVEALAYAKALTIMRDVIDGLDKLPGVQMPAFQLPDPPDATAWERHFLGLSDAAAQAARVSGEKWTIAFGQISSGLNQISRHFDNAFGEILAGAAEVSGSLSVLFDPEKSGIQKFFAALDLAISLGKKAIALFRDEAHEATNDIRDDFLLTFGPSGLGANSGFHVLAAQLHELGPAGDALFQRLINAKKVEEFNAVVAQIGPALAEAFANRPENLAAAAGFQTIAELEAIAAKAVTVFEYMRDSGLYTAEAVQQAWERAQEALAKSGDQSVIAAQQATDAIKKLEGELQSFAASLQAEQDAPEYNEAGERIYGVIESQQLARKAAIEAEMKAIEEQRIAAQEANRDTEEQRRLAAQEASRAIEEQRRIHAQEAISDIQQLVAETDFVASLRFEYDLPNGVSIGGKIPAMASGGIVRKPTLALIGEAGPEAVVPLSEYNRTSGPTRSVTNGALTVNFYGDVDSRARADRLVEDISKAIRRGGKARDTARKAGLVS